jgi:hypothetical protein
MSDCAGALLATDWIDFGVGLAQSCDIALGCLALSRDATHFIVFYLESMCITAMARQRLSVDPGKAAHQGLAHVLHPRHARTTSLGIHTPSDIMHTSAAE